MTLLRTSLFAATFAVSSAQAITQFAVESDLVRRQGGCYIVDYSFTEVEGLKPGYTLDERVYDTKHDKTTFELILPIQKSPTEIRLQHVLFVKDLETGKVAGLMKHHAEDWQYQAPFHWEFVAPGAWTPQATAGSGRWVRKTTNLDDGLRYQCEAAWDTSKANPEWNCANFAPIPGRETRDMGRKDYNTIDRHSRVIVYENSWVERQNNVKTIFADGQKTPLARELGRTWYVRQPDSACDEAREYAAAQMPYWNVLMEVWEETLSKPSVYREVSARNGMPRYAAMMGVEMEYSEQVAANPAIIPTVKERIRAIIEAYRVRP